MDYVGILRFRKSVSSSERDAALGRRAGWTYPKGVKVIAEYWPMAADVQVVTIFSTDDPGAVLELELEWSDVFDIDIHPALSADDGLKVGPDVMGRLTRLKA